MNGRVAQFLFGGLALSTAMAAVFYALNLPLAWILGSMVGSALYVNLVSTSGQTHIIRRGGQLVIGSAVVAVLDVDTVDALFALLPVMIGAAVLANLVGLALALPLARFGGMDRLTALLAALPAGMAEMASLAAELKARTDVVLIAHSLRVVLVVVTVPLLVGLDATSLGPASAPANGSYPVLALCFVLGLLLAIVADRLNLLNPWIVMPMVVGVALVLAGVQAAPMPRPILVAAQIAIGFSLGTRLRRQDLVRIPRAAVAALGASALLLAAMMLGARFLLAPLAGLDLPSAALSLAPGGLAEMIATAKALGLASATVASFQFVRSFMTNLVAPLVIVRLVKARAGGK